MPPPTLNYEEPAMLLSNKPMRGAACSIAVPTRCQPSYVRQPCTS